MFWKNLWRLLRRTYDEWSEDNVSRLAASLAYYAIFSLAPLLLIAIAIASWIFGPQAAHHQVHQQARELVGAEGTKAIYTLLHSAGRHGSGVIATMVAIILVLYGATNVFAELQSAMDTIWEVQPRPGLGILATIRRRFLSFVMVLVIAVLLLLSLVLSAVLTGIVTYFQWNGAWVWEAINISTSLIVFTLLFAMTFKFLPDVKILWRDVWLGALITGILFTAGKFLIGLYLGRSSVSSIYGAAGSIIILLLWIYYSAQILFIGAEFTQVYATWRGERIEPDEAAIHLTEDHRIHQGIPHRSTIHARLHPTFPPQPQPQAERPARPTSPSPHLPIASSSLILGSALALAGLVAARLLLRRHDHRPPPRELIHRQAERLHSAKQQAADLLTPAQRHRLDDLERQWRRMA